MSNVLFFGALLLVVILVWELLSDRRDTPTRDYHDAFQIHIGPGFWGATSGVARSAGRVALPVDVPTETAIGRLLHGLRPGAPRAMAEIHAGTGDAASARPASGDARGAPAEDDPAGFAPGWSRRIGAFAASGMLGIGLGVVAVRLPHWVPTHPVVASSSPRPSAPSSLGLEASVAVPVPMSAPFYETWSGGSMAALSQESGAKNLILAFVVTPKKGECTVYWNGDPRTPVTRALFGNDIAAIRARGGDVIASFGGGVWGTIKTELAVACTDINAIAAVYENVITTYNLTRIDFNIEGDPLWDKEGIDRRNKALKLVQDWAARQHRALQVSYTLAAALHGLPESAMSLLRNALSNGVRVDVVNLMPFDYCDKARHSMITVIKDGVTGLHDQLVDLYPKRSPDELWHMIGVTVMPGIDDCGEGEIFTVANAEKLVSWAAAQGLTLLSFWALQRDNGGCPGATSSSGRCSGLIQSTWQFTQIFAPFPALRRGA